ncbi:universal stress protein [Halodesulfovibrio aestuarii]|uniref:Universal stress protein n=1 Tax=Halodesulfovibrio aestuarii TaxID=126333 RepID=A0A8G2FBS0_9BACT|nr:universal stress protein [Halodesulfovibrio aestuarii]SHJ40200.1 Nucleotide-binding universal stress protein, UspA family [Halodesulfovibrio aestuarii]
MEIKKILLPVDGSEYSSNAAEEAISLAKKFDAEIILLYCSETFQTLKQFKDFSVESIEYANKILAPVREMLKKAGARYIERVIDNSPSEEIPRVAKKENVDLIIMAPRGTNPLASILLGSVTTRVLKQLPCNVLVVHKKS